MARSSSDVKVYSLVLIQAFEDLLISKHGQHADVR